ncbi:hypothetical protein C9439_07480 [archaeon SCG-AAA382B04]|nr:hypothetical protein C9439_07480 [archaeon SCG-AAA382B04]
MKEKLVSKLNKLGLNEYEARTYLTLLAGGQQTAKQISENSDVPYSRIYDILADLRKDDWVEEIDSNPKRFQANHESFTLKKTRDEMENLIDDLEKEIKSYKKTSYQKYEPEILILEGWESISHMMTTELMKTEKTVTTMLGFDAEFFQEFLKKAVRRNINFNLITRLDLQLPKEILENIEKNKMPFTPKLWVTWFDWKKIIAIFPSMKDGDILEEDVRGLLLTDKNFGDWANQIVENLDFNQEKFFP